MKKKSILFSIMVILSALSLNAQIEVEQEVVDEPESPTQGFFVKGGTQKIDALECYNFKDLILSFDLKEEYFNCDKVIIELDCGYPIYKYSLDQNEFSSLFKGKEYAYFKIFSSDNMEQNSGWKDPRGYYLTRKNLQYTTNKKQLQGSKMKATIYCGIITGEEEVTEMQSDKLVTRKHYTWRWTGISTFSIELKNRIFINSFRLYFIGYPKAPVAAGDCYE